MMICQVDKLWPYRAGSFSDKFKNYKKRMNSKKPLLVEEKIKNIVADKFGIYFDDLLDNRSTYSLDMLFDGLMNYGSDGSTNYDPEIMKKAYADAINAFKVTKFGYLKPIPIDEVQETMDMSKSSGLPALTSKGEVYDTGLQRAKDIIEGKKIPHPCIAFTRTQFKSKTRLVWGYPLEMTIIESMFAVPMMNRWKANTPMLNGHSKLNIGCLMKSLSLRYKNSLGIDFSRFDQTVSAGLIRKAFSIIRSVFGGERRLSKAMNKALSIAENYFVHTPIVMPDGIIYKKHKGIPSGSTLTQLVGSIVNYLIINYTFRKLNIVNKTIYVLGDDSITFYNEEISLSEVAKLIKRDFHMTVHPDKCTTNKDGVVVLGYDWSRITPIEDIMKTFKKVIYPETPRPKVGNFKRFIEYLFMTYAQTNADFLKYTYKVYRHRRLRPGEIFQPFVHDDVFYLIRGRKDFDGTVERKKSLHSFLMDILK